VKARHSVVEITGISAVRPQENVIVSAGLIFGVEYVDILYTAAFVMA